MSARRTAGEIEIVVRDEGSGIAVRDSSRYLQAARFHSRIRRLGLHIVETIVKQDDGQVRAVNRPDGRGAEFTIRIPAGAPNLAIPARA